MFVFTPAPRPSRRLAYESHAQNQIDRFLSLARRTDDEPLVILQHLEPVLHICRTVSEAVRRLKSRMIDQRRRANLCDQFFFAVRLRAEEGDLLKSVQAAGMACAVRQFMEGCAVILSSLISYCAMPDFQR